MLSFNLSFAISHALPNPTILATFSVPDRIPLEEGDKWVEVIGTYVIPEFGSIVIIILVVAVSSAIIISKSRFSVRYN